MASSRTNTFATCHYLVSSVEALKKAIDDYNTARYGSVESSLSLFIKAWNALFLANRMLLAEQATATKGILWRGDASLARALFNNSDTKDHIFGLENYNEYAKHCGKAMPSNESSFSEIYNLYHEEYEGDDKKPRLEDITHASFHPGKLISLFQEFSVPKSPVGKNWEVIYKLRNYDQHDFLEMRVDYGYAELVRSLNPFVVAHISNYLRGYEQLHKEVVRHCSNWHDSRNCPRGQLREQPPSYLQGYAHFPFGLEAVETPENRPYLSAIDSSRPTVRKHLAEVVTKLEADLSNWQREDPRFKMFSPLNNNKSDLEILKLKQKSNLPALQKRFVFGKLSEVVRSINAQDLHEEQEPLKVSDAQTFKDTMAARLSEAEREKYFFQFPGATWPAYTQSFEKELRQRWLDDDLQFYKNLGRLDES